MKCYFMFVHLGIAALWLQNFRDRLKLCAKLSRTLFKSCYIVHTNSITVTLVSTWLLFETDNGGKVLIANKKKGLADLNWFLNTMICVLIWSELLLLVCIPPHGLLIYCSFLFFFDQSTSSILTYSKYIMMIMHWPKDVSTKAMFN